MVNSKIRYWQDTLITTLKQNQMYFKSTLSEISKAWALTFILTWLKIVLKRDHTFDEKKKKKIFS